MCCCNIPCDAHATQLQADCIVQPNSSRCPSACMCRHECPCVQVSKWLLTQVLLHTCLSASVQAGKCSVQCTNALHGSASRLLACASVSSFWGQLAYVASCRSQPQPSSQLRHFQVPDCTAGAMITKVPCLHPDTKRSFTFPQSQAPACSYFHAYLTHLLCLPQTPAAHCSGTGHL